jgi:hypothetical protein
MMNNSKFRNFQKITFVLFVLLFASSNINASGNKKEKENKLSYSLEWASVDINYISMHDPNTTNQLTLKNIKPAEFIFSKNMSVNTIHVRKGSYEVSLIEYKSGLGFNFHSTVNSKQKDIQVALNEKKGKYNEWLNYELEIVENDKIAGEFNWKGSNYAFSMEVSISNSIFSYLNKEEKENTTEWIDYYQAAIYSYKNNIDLENSYSWAEKALKTDQNEYTLKLNMLYLEALGR